MYSYWMSQFYVHVKVWWSALQCRDIEQSILVRKNCYFIDVKYNQYTLNQLEEYFKMW